MKQDRATCTLDGRGGRRIAMDDRTADGGAGGRSWMVPGYTHGRQLGAGAAGRVVEAVHDATGTPVAVKYLNSAGRGAGDLRAEAALLAGLDCPNVARLYEFVEGPEDQAIVMELVDGVTLRDLLAAQGATAPEAALTVLKGSLLGLAAAHTAGVVHRDYKPGNVLATTSGTSKLIDFGIALHCGDTGQVAGTPAYMAPEQWTGHPASPAGDVYAATATFFECLTGAKPYQGTTLVELAVQHTEAPIPDEQAPEALRPLIRRGLAKTPADRPETAQALVTELEAIAQRAYGEDWEDRGRAQLAALAALLLPLLPSGSGTGPASGTTALATTTLPAATVRAVHRVSSRAKLLTATGVVLLAGTLAGAALGHNATAGTPRHAALAPVATASPDAGPGLPLTPDATRGAHSPGTAKAPPPNSGTPQTRPAPRTATTPATGSSGRRTPVRVAPTGPSTASTPAVTPGPLPPPPTADPAPGSPGLPPRSSPTVTPSRLLPAPVLHVDSVSLGTPACWGRYGMSVTVTVSTDGAATGTLTVTWLDSNGNVVGSDTLTLPAGQTSFSQAFHHAFAAGSGDWGVQVSASPAAAHGQDSAAQLLGATCSIQ